MSEIQKLAWEPHEAAGNHPQRVTFFFTCRKQAGMSLWHRGAASAWSGRQGYTPILPPALLACHSPGLPSLWFTTILFTSNTWTSLKKKSMQFGLNASFFKNLIFQIQIIEAPLKKKIQLPHNQLLYVKKKALLQWLKTILEHLWQIQSGF